MGCSPEETHDFLLTCGAHQGALTVGWIAFAVVSGLVALFALHAAVVSRDWRHRLPLLLNVLTGLISVAYGLLRVLRSGDDEEGERFGVTPAVSWLYAIAAECWNIGCIRFVSHLLRSATLPLLRLGAGAGAGARASAAPLSPSSAVAPLDQRSPAQGRSPGGGGLGELSDGIIGVLRAFDTATVGLVVLSLGIWTLVPAITLCGRADTASRDALLLAFWAAGAVYLAAMLLLSRLAVRRLVHHIDACMSSTTARRRRAPSAGGGNRALRAARQRLLFARKHLTRTGVSTVLFSLLLACWPWLRRQASSYFFCALAMNGSLSMVATTVVMRQTSAAAAASSSSSAAASPTRPPVAITYRRRPRRRRWSAHGRPEVNWRPET